MNPNNFRNWTSNHSKIGMLYTLILCGVVLVYFNVRAVHPAWFLIIIGISVWYFSTLSICINRWEKLPSRRFERRLFWYSLLFRVIASIILITVAYVEWGIPNHVGSVDGEAYHREALMVAEHFRSFDFSSAYETARSFYFPIDNIGPSLFIGFIFAIFADSYFMATVVIATLGSISVVMLYRIGKIIWGEKIGRTAGILFMHFPLALFFSVVISKEGVVLFLLMVIVYFLTKAVNGQKLKFTHISILVFSLFSLFFFRTVVGLILVLLVSGTLLLNKYKGSRIKSWSIGTVAIFIFGYLMYWLGEYQFFIDRFLDAESHGEGRMADMRLENFGLDIIKIENVILAPVVLAGSIIPPFPGMVNVPTRFETSHDSNWYFMAGEIVWNILVFYSFPGIYYSLKDKFFSSMPVWGFTFAYSFAMVVTIFFTRVRFSYLGMPLLFIFVAVGLSRSKNKVVWILYLGLILIITVYWNILRLNVHGV